MTQAEEAFVRKSVDEYLAPNLVLIVIPLNERGECRVELDIGLYVWANCRDGSVRIPIEDHDAWGAWSERFPEQFAAAARSYAERKASDDVWLKDTKNNPKAHARDRVPGRNETPGGGFKLPG